MQATLQTLYAAHGSAFRGTKVAGPKREPLAVCCGRATLTALLLLRPANAFFLHTQNWGTAREGVR